MLAESCRADRLQPLMWLSVWLLLGSVGCAIHKVPRELPTRELEPFSESGRAVVPDRWWTTFGDAALDRRVDEALGSNFTLATALQRLRASRALARRSASDLLPDVNGFLDFDSDFGPGPDGASLTWGFDAAYQVDLWGQIQSRVEADNLRADATDADYHAVALTLAAEVARTWFALIESHAQLDVLAEQVETNRTGLKAQELRFGRGFVRAADVLRQRQLVESTLEQEVIVQAQIEILEHQLAILLGQLPQSATYSPGAQLPELPALPNTGLPSELLLRRPDVQRDYLEFLAADRDLASAISAQYPRINLAGAVFSFADQPERLFRDWFVTMAGQIVAPLIDGGQRRAEVERTDAVAGERFYEYGLTMLIAFREVEDNLALERYQIERIKLLESQLDLAQQSSQQLREQYLIGEVDYLDVLSAIQSQQRLQRDVLSARLDLVLIRVGLYLALAGGFDLQPEIVAELPLDFIDPAMDVPDLEQDAEELPPPVEVAPELDIDD